MLHNTNCRIKHYLFKDTLQVSNWNIFSSSSSVPVVKSNKFIKNVVPAMVKYPTDIFDYIESCSSDCLFNYLSDSKKNDGDKKLRSLYESRRRAKASVSDIALCNQFEYMFTWTLSDEYIDRYDSQTVYTTLRHILSNLSRRKEFNYVLIPEYHSKVRSDGKKAIHFHGLCNIGSCSIVPSFSPNSGKRLFSKSGQPIFNMLDWKLGYSTVVPLNSDYLKAVNYVTKYITKSESKIFGKWYLSSRCLVKKPDIDLLESVNFDVFKEKYPDAYISNIYDDCKIICVDLIKGS